MKHLPNQIFYIGQYYEDLEAKVLKIFGKCPSCGGDIYNGMISCPDCKKGCLMAHFGFGCGNCKKVFSLK